MSLKYWLVFVKPIIIEKDNDVLDSGCSVCQLARFLKISHVDYADNSDLIASSFRWMFTLQWCLYGLSRN